MTTRNTELFSDDEALLLHSERWFTKNIMYFAQHYKIVQNENIPIKIQNRCI
jgi:hypothetical protein